jgi:hypothetical protein
VVIPVNWPGECLVRERLQLRSQPCRGGSAESLFDGLQAIYRLSAMMMFTRERPYAQDGGE